MVIDYFEISPKMLEMHLEVKVKERYSQAHRFYHNFTHVKTMMTLLNNYRDIFKITTREYRILTMAIYYHDVVYNTPMVERYFRYSSNEVQSAQACHDELKGFFEYEILDRILHLIMSTEYIKCVERSLVSFKDRRGEDRLISILHDLDFYGFMDSTTCSKNDELIMFEYVGLNPSALQLIPFLKGRLQFLNAAAQIPIYETEYFRKFNDTANDNIKASIKKLKENNPDLI